MNRIVNHLSELFPEHLHKRIVLVGGCVRDHLLGKTESDIDLSAALTESELQECGFRRVTASNGNQIWLRNDRRINTIELTRLPHLSDLRQDLIRRDFTINAMAMDLGLNLIDPLGGRHDLARKQLRTCTPDCFTADPIRIFRALRLEAVGMRMSSETEVLITSREWAQQLAPLPVERFSREMLKACAAPVPDRFFRRMADLGVGAEFLPELFAMATIPAGPPLHHPEGDLLTHSIQVLQRVTRLSADPLARFCAFFHDIGKLATDPANYPRHHGHDRLGVNLASTLCERLRLPFRHRRALSGVSLLHSLLNKWEELRAGTRIQVAEQALRREITAILPFVSAADKSRTLPEPGWKTTCEVASMKAIDLGIDTGHLLESKPELRREIIHCKRVEILLKRDQENAFSAST